MKVLGVLLSFLVLVSPSTYSEAAETTSPTITTINPACLPGDEDCDGQPTGTKITDLSDCHKYYLCVDDEIGAGGTAFECNNGTYFNGTDCVDEITPCVNPCDPTSPPPTTTLPPTTGPPVLCRTRCEAGVTYIPDPYDCSKFYQCAPTPNPGTCGEPTPFFNGNACVDDESQCCDACIPYCDEAHINQQIADPLDCRSYYFCREKGIPTDHKNCENDQVFYSESGKCVVDPDGCKNYCNPVSSTTEITPSTESSNTTGSTETGSTTTESTIPESTTTESTTTETIESTTSTATTELTSPPPPFCDIVNLCGEVAPGALVGDPYDCHVYYRCSNTSQISLSFTCDQGFYFNGTECSQETTPCVPVCVQYCPIECDIENNVNIIADPQNCTNYYVCTAGVPSLKQSCSVEEPYFNGTVCTNDPRLCCDVCTPYCTEDDLGNSINDPNDCRSYYNCYYVGVPTNMRTCSADDYFDTLYQQCVVGTCENYCT